MKDTIWLILGITGIVFAAIGLAFAFQTVTETKYLSHRFGEYIPYTETSKPYLIPGLVIGAFGGLLATVGFAVFARARMKVNKS